MKYAHRNALAGICICVLVLLPGLLAAQLGVPFLKQYAARDYPAGPENHAVALSIHGLLYVANADTLLEFDGTTWRGIPGTLGQPIQRLVLGQDRRLYALGNTALGVLTVADSGRVALQPIAAGAVKGPLQCAWATPDGVYAVFTGTTLRLQYGASSACTVSNAAPDKRQPLPRLIYHPTVGLAAAVGTTISPWIAKPLLSGTDAVVAMTPWGDTEVLVVTRTGRLLRFNGWTFRPLLTAAADDLANAVVTDVTLLPGRLIALGTLRNGLFVLDARGQLLLHLDRSSGLQNESIRGLMADPEGGLWLALESGITRADLLAPLTYFNADAGLQGAVSAIITHRDTLYAATDRGLYYLDRATLPGHFEAVRGIATATYSLSSFGGHLLAATDAGLFEVQPAGARRLRSWPSRALFVGEKTRGKLFIGTESGLAVAELVRFRARKRIKYGNSYRWAVVPDDSLALRRVGPGSPAIHTLTEDARGVLWAANNESLYTLSYSTIKGRRVGRRILPDRDTVAIQLLGAEQGLPAGAPHLYRQGRGQIIVAAGSAMYAYDFKTGLFTPDTTLAEPGKSIGFFNQDAFNDRLLVAGNMVRYGAWQPLDKSYAWDSTALQLKADARLLAAFRENKARYWLGFTDGLILFEPQRKTVQVPPYQALIRQVIFDGAAVPNAGGLPDSLTSGGDTLIWPAFEARGHQGATRFEFAATRFAEDPGLEYRWALSAEGDSIRWSDWSKQAYAQLVGIRHNDYTLYVQARDAGGRLSRLAMMPISLLPYWYTTWWARTLFVLLGLAGAAGIGYVSVRLYSIRLRQQNEELEALVQERTQEIEDKNAQLNEYAEEIRAHRDQIQEDKRIIEQKNRDITDSITYARRIQEAMLPRTDLIKAALDQFFVFYQPRDIISGDFYWFAQHERQVLIAAADCTGHGVPGALMAMIGTGVLDRIFHEQKITEPAEILRRLHLGLRDLLGQSKNGLPIPAGPMVMRDGMDICLCRIDFDANVMYAASANRPIWRVVNGELYETKGDRRPIGGPEPDVAFSQHAFPLTPGTTFYLFSDGIVDQFGGKDGRKFLSKRLREHLLRHQDLDMIAQAATLDTTIRDWRGAREQVDDILVIGLRF